MQSIQADWAVSSPFVEDTAFRIPDACRCLSGPDGQSDTLPRFDSLFHADCGAIVQMDDAGLVSSTLTVERDIFQHGVRLHGNL